VRVFLEFTWRAFPDLRFESTDGPFLDPSEPKAAFYWRSFATNSGPIDPPGLAATGKQIEFEGGDFHEYRDGKLVRLCIVFDMARVMRKLGALPDPGTREERLVVGLANLRGKLRRRG
jgi:predicted ester cyclase